MQPNSIVQSAQDQANQNFNNDFGSSPLSSLASEGSTLSQAQQALNGGNTGSTNALPGTSAAPHTSILQRLLPTVGGIGGGILGEVLDPFGGGIAGAALGAGLAGGGAAAGKVAENATSGQNLGSGVLTSGLEGSVGQGIGEGAGALLGKAGEAVGGLGAKMAAKDAATASDADAQQAALDEANANKNNFGGVRPEVQASNNMAGNQELLKSFGVDPTDPEAMQNAAKGGLFINNLDNEALALGNPIKTTDLLNSHDIATASEPEQQAFANAGIITPEGGMPSTVTPQQANSFAQDLNNQVRDTQQTMTAAKMAGRSADYAALKNQYTQLNGLYKNVQNVAGTPEVNQAIADRVVTPAEKSQLVDQFGDPEANHIEDAVNNAQTHQDLVKAKLPFAQMNDLSNGALQDMKATGTPRALARVKAAVTPSSGGNLLSPDNVVGAGSLYEGLLKGHPLALAAPLAMKAAESPAAVQGAGSILRSVGASAAPAVAGQVVANSPNDVAGPANSGTGVTLPPTQGNSVLDQALYEAMQNPLNGGLSQVGSLLPLVQKANAAQAAEQNLAQIYNQAGGAQGPLGGRLGILGSLFTGGEPASYNGQAEADRQAIAQALGEQPGQISTPSLTQNQSAAQASLGNIQSLIQALTMPQGQTPGLVGAVQ